MSPRPASSGKTGEPQGGVRTLLESSDGRLATVREVLESVEFSSDLEGQAREKLERTAVLRWLRKSGNPHPTLLAQLLLKGWLTDAKYDSYFPGRDRDIQLPPKTRYYLESADE